MIETQYIDLFGEYRDVINAKSAAGLNNLRDQALKAFTEQGFPTNRQEDFRYIDISAEFIPNFGINLNRVPFEGNPYIAFKCEVDDLPTNFHFVLNDLFHDEYLTEVHFPKGVYVGSLKKFADLHPAVFAQYYGQIANVNKSGIVAFNTMFAQDGFVVYVPKGVIVDTPIQLTNILKSNVDALINRRVLVIAEDDAQLKLLICDHTVDDSHFLVTQVTEIFAGRNALVDVYEIEENSDKVSRLASTFVTQMQASNVLLNNLTLNCGTTRNNYYVSLAGEHAEVYVCGMVIADRKQYVDNFAYLDHAVPNCQSTQLFKYVLQDEAVGVFCGRILVQKDAQKTLAYQTNNNLCISPKSRMYSKPQLEIYADDVKCSHGLTTGQLDEDALFYLRSRGLTAEQARMLLMQAFAAAVLNHVRIDKLRESLQGLVEKRFRGESARCGNCAVCK